MHLNIYPTKIIVGIVAGFLAVFETNLMPLVVMVFVFEAVDFITGVIKSAVVAKRKKEKFAFESIKAWRTIYKVVFILIGIALAEMLDQALVIDGRLRFANYFAVFCCAVEFWSFLENAAVISNHPLFKWLRRFMKFKVEDELGMTFDEAQGKKPRRSRPRKNEYNDIDNEEFN